MQKKRLTDTLGRQYFTYFAPMEECRALLSSLPKSIAREHDPEFDHCTISLTAHLDRDLAEPFVFPSSVEESDLDYVCKSPMQFIHLCMEFADELGMSVDEWKTEQDDIWKANPKKNTAKQPRRYRLQVVGSRCWRYPQLLGPFPSITDPSRSMRRSPQPRPRFCE